MKVSAMLHCSVMPFLNGHFFPIVFIAPSLLFDVWFPLFLVCGASVAINIEGRAISFSFGIHNNGRPNVSFNKTQTHNSLFNKLNLSELSVSLKQHG